MKNFGTKETPGTEPNENTVEPKDILPVYEKPPEKPKDTFKRIGNVLVSEKIGANAKSAFLLFGDSLVLLNPDNEKRGPNLTTIVFNNGFKLELNYSLDHALSEIDPAYKKHLSQNK